MIEINNISFGYSKRRPPIYQNFSLTIDHGGIYGLLGSNGSGKSTLLYLICGLLPTNSGSILIDGQSTANRPPQTMRDVYLVPERIELPDLSYKQYVALHHDYYPHFSEDDLKDCLQRFNVSPEGDFTGLWASGRSCFSVLPSPPTRATSSWTSLPAASTSRARKSSAG